MFSAPSELRLPVASPGVLARTAAGSFDVRATGISRPRYPGTRPSLGPVAFSRRAGGPAIGLGAHELSKRVKRGFATTRSVKARGPPRLERRGVCDPEPANAKQRFRDRALIRATG